MVKYHQNNPAGNSLRAYSALTDQADIGLPRPSGRMKSEGNLVEEVRLHWGRVLVSFGTVGSAQLITKKKFWAGDRAGPAPLPETEARNTHRSDHGNTGASTSRKNKMGHDLRS